MKNPRRLYKARCIVSMFCLIGAFCFFSSLASGQESVKRIALKRWQVSLDQGKTWKPIQVPGTIEDQIQTDFDGISYYQTKLEPIAIPQGYRLFLGFDAVATEATVTFNQSELGKHLGGWTPFRFDITKRVREAKGPCSIEVKCDEKVGHNTQGFLPVFAPHFSGIWKSAYIELVPDLHINLNRSFAWGDLDNKKQLFEVHVNGWQKGMDAELWVEVPFAANPFQSEEEIARNRKRHENDPRNRKTWKLTGPVMQLSIADPAPSAWSPETPSSKSRRVTLIQRNEGRILSRSVWNTSVAFRSIKTKGDKLLLNGKPLQVRGLLNWGYAPPGVAPSLDEEFMIDEILFAKDRGFNLMKFCLWIPPKRYLELCDEFGMLAWVEYPTWHPKLTPEHLDNLKQEYEEFFYYVRQHPSVILHSLTCETGPSADIEVIRELYQLCKKRIPGAIVEDDSSWIAWNRVHDFYDDHPYGNNHTWVKTLDRLKKHIADRETKPLILGEAIAADTWTDPRPILKRTGGKETHWTPGFLLASDDFIKRRFPDEKTRESELEQLQKDSNRYAMLMRKFQMETYRREVPDGGYVSSVIRDVPLCGMGLIDYLGKAKTSPDEWNWHGDIMLVLNQKGMRSYFANEKTNFEIIASNRSGRALGSELKLQSKGNASFAGQQFPETRIEADKNNSFQTDLKFGIVSRPERIRVKAELSPEIRVIDFGTREMRMEPTATNQWEFWVFPRIAFRPGWSGALADPKTDLRFGNLYLHSSIKKTIEAEYSGEQLSKSAKILDWNSKQTVRPEDRILTHVIDDELLQALEKGAQVILLANGKSKSFRTSEHWFLRGSPILNRQLANHFCPTNAIIDLQHFDLAGPVIPQIQFEDSIEPMISLWDNHDLKEMRLHGLVFRMPLGRGNLVVSALNHFGKTNAAGNYLLKQIVNCDYGHSDFASRKNSEKNLARLRAEIDANEIDLSKSNWKFRPDPDKQGQDQKWFAGQLKEDDWSEIKITSHWEGQGHKSLDNWAWYRKTIRLPDDWKGEKTYLNFTGVDDHYRVYVNGQFIGQDGDIEKKETAFENRKSWDITQQVKAGESVVIAVAVYDWYGAGGIFRPVTISNIPLSQKRPWLVK